MLIYDGDCGFCTQSAHWVQDHLATPISVVPWQQIRDVGELGLTPADLTTAAYWVDAYGRTSRGHRAIAEALGRCQRPFSLLGWLLLIPPFSWLAAVVYVIVARNRHRLPGATEACRLPAGR